MSNLFIVFYFIIISFNLNAINQVKTSLADLIAKTGDYSPKKFKLSELDDLYGILSNKKEVSSVRLKRIHQMIRSLGEYQFPSDLTIRELIANAIDSYYYDNLLANLSSKPVSVMTDDSNGCITISDQGIGMGINEIVFYLMTPTRSQNNAILDPKNAISGVTGRFGQGFFSVLSFLKNADDNITVITQQEGQKAYQLIIEKDLINNEFIVIIENLSQRNNRGTNITIKSSSLRNKATSLAQKIIPQYFAYNKRSEIYLNRNIINDIKLRAINIPINDRDKISIYVHDKIVNNESSNIKIMVNGILIKEFKVSGYNLLSDIVIDLPVNTSLTADRTTLDFNDIKNQSYINQIINYGISNNNFPLANSAYLLLKEYFAGGSIFAYLPPYVIPASSESFAIAAIKLPYGITATEYIHPDLFTYDNYQNLPSSYKSPTVIIVPVEFKDDKTKAVISDNNNPNLVFIDYRIGIYNKFIAYLMNLLYKINQEKLGKKNPPSLLGEKDLQNLSPLISSSVNNTSLSNNNASWLLAPTSLEQQDRANKKILDGWATYDKYDEKYHDIIFNIIYNLAMKNYPINDHNNSKFNSFIKHLYLIYIKNKNNYDDNIIFLNNILNGKNIDDDFEKNINNLTKLIGIFHNNYTDDDNGYNRTLFSEGFAGLLYNIINVSFKVIADGKLNKDILLYTEYYETILYHVDKEIIKKQSLLSFGDSDSESIINSSIKYLNICNKNNLTKSENIIYYYYRLLYGIDNSENKDKLENYIVKYLSKLNFKLDHYYDELFQHFEIYHVLMLTDNQINNNIEGIIAINRLYHCINHYISYYSPNVRKNMKSILPNMLKDLINGQIDKNDIEKIVNGWPINLQIKDINVSIVDYVFNILEENNVLSSAIFPYIYQILFGDMIKFYAEKQDFASENINNNNEIYNNKKVKEIMGGDKDLIRKNYKNAVWQNFQPYFFLKELIKNAKEASSQDFYVNAITDKDDKFILEIRDHGSGVDKKHMYYFYIPGLTSKAKMNEDINFGWGFFTVFVGDNETCFDEAIIESSTDGKTISKVYLKKDENDRFYISTSSYENSNFRKGTKISLRRSFKNASKFDPVLIKSNLIRFTEMSNRMKIYFNDELLLKNDNRLSYKYKLAGLKIDNDKEIEIYANNDGGVFYNKLLHRDSIVDYINLLPIEIKKIINKLPNSFAINFNGSFKNNAGRNGFLEEEKFKPDISKLLQDAIFKQLAFSNANNPELLKDIFPNDFYYEFKPGPDFQPSVDRVLQLVVGNNLPLSDLLKDTSDFAAFTTTLPVLPSFRQNLMDIKCKIKDILLKANIIDNYGNYNVSAQLNTGYLIGEIKENSLNNLIKYFEYQIQKQIEIIKAQSSINNSQQFFDDFSVANIPHQYASKLDIMKKFVTFVEELSLKVIGKKIKIYFYDKADGNVAHAQQGQNDASRIIAFNLRGQYWCDFEKMFENNLFDKKIFLYIIETLTHELVHTHELIKQATHNKDFFEKQENFLQPFFMITDKELSQYAHDLGLYL